MHKITVKLFAALLGVLSVWPFLPADAYSVPQISAESAILIEAEAGTVISEYNADSRMPMASTTKIMTAILALEHSSPDDIFTVVPEATGIEGSSVYLVAGEELSADELVYALMLESANDAACAIACSIAGTVEDFAELMNAKAEELGMRDTHFTNPHGLDDSGHYTTARDLATLTAYALQNPDFVRIVSTRKKVISKDGETRVLVNHNKMLALYPDALGVKTGYTKKSGRCLVSAASRDGVTLVAVTLNAPDDWNDHRALLDLGFETYQRVTVSGSFELQLPCVGGEAESVQVGLDGELTLPLPNGHGEITSTVELPDFVFAPVNEGDSVGTVRYYLDGREIGSLPIVYRESVAQRPVKRGFFNKIFG